MYEISKKTNKNRGVPKDELEDLLFKRGLEKEFKNNLIEFVKDLEKTSTYYRKVKDGDFLSNQINRMCLLLTTHLAEWEFLPVALSYLNKYGEDDNFLKFIILFEKIYLHHWFSDENKGGRESFCYHTISNMNNKASFFELKNAMIEVSKNDYFDFFNKNIYLKSNRLTKYVLLRIDQEMQDSSVSKQYSGKITIEHILPQQMKDSYWTSRFSVNDHGQWVHKLGNLTLISGQKNSAASNGSFDKKRTVYEGQGKKVSFDIAKDVFQYKEWNLDNLKKRHQFLLDKAKEIWFVDKNKQLSI
jgi:hypothetical protein